MRVRVSDGWGGQVIRAVVVDDEPVARRGLVRLLDEEEGVELVGEAADGEEALRILRLEAADVVFLDVRMPRLDGVAVADALARMERPPLVVFVTAYDEHAVRAFELEATDYVLKPFDRGRLQETLERVKRRLRRSALEEVDSAGRVLRRVLGAEGAVEGPDRLVVNEGGTVHLLPPEEIDLIRAEGNYVGIHRGGDELLVRETLSGLETRLEGRGFQRISRSTLVNLDRVRKVVPGTSGTAVAVLEDGRRLPVSRRAVAGLRRALEELG